MTSLEKFLVKRKVEKTTEETKVQASEGPRENTELITTISNLKNIFPEEPEDRITLLALQYKNPHELESVVQKILEEGSSLQNIAGDWSTVKSRDKKKPEPQKKKGKNRRRYQEAEEQVYEQNYSTQNKYNRDDNYYPRGSNRRGGYTEQYKRKDYGQEKAYYEPRKQNFIENDKKVEVPKAYEAEKTPVEVQENVIEVQEKVVEIEEKPKENVFGNFPELPTSYAGLNNQQGFWDDVEPENPPTEIIENKYNSNPPDTIHANEHVEENKIPKEVSEKVFSGVQSPKNLKEEKKTQPEKIVMKTAEVGVQVELDYGIPIIVYPYMFQRNNY
ncbi:hypothetical protein SteCoe_22349 [Stentor coeruleus]|uniref:Uncharacterized protein n=1 Tax=Stentor coeruleus TaxID=5963 RepID=A0A1R2BN10_9CILI|nr:hypothetical protein SteCoe_22349 [Stentor coeruleus]